MKFFSNLGIGPERAALLTISKEAKRRKELHRQPSLENPNGSAGGWNVPDSKNLSQTDAAMIQKIAYT